MKHLCCLAMSLLLISSLPAQSPTPTGVLVMLTVKPGVEREQVMKVMPEEIRATVRLYLDGKIRDWYSRADGKGVVFILACNNVPEAKSVMDGLPLSKAQLVNLEYTGIAPLRPLELLLDGQAKHP